MRPRSRASLALLLALLLAACAGASQPTPQPAPPSAAPVRSLTIFAAASLTEAFEEIGAAFQRANPEVEIIYSFAGSQQLAAQLAAGAPADIFASANRAQMDAAIAATRVVSGTQQTFARNRLVVVTPSDNPASIQTLQDLARPGVTIVLADRAVPVGQYSLDMLARASALPEYTASYSATVLANVVSYEESVRAVLAKVALGEADAGIVYATDAALDADKLQQLAIPDPLNTVASYPIAPIANSASPELSQAFIAFILSPEGQQILARYGFIT